MPTPALFRYSMKTADNTLWYWVDTLGVVRTANTPRYFKDDTGHQSISPVDWKDTQVGITRNEKLYGVFAKFSVPIKFTYQAIAILKHIYATDGYEGTTIFTIEQRNNTNWQYAELISCEIDLSQVQSVLSAQEVGVTVTAAEQGLAEDLNTKQDLETFIPFDGDALTIEHDGIILEFTYTWVGGSLDTPVPYATTAGKLTFPDAAPSQVDGSAYLDNFLFSKYQPFHDVDNDNTKFILYSELPLNAIVTVEYDVLYTASATAVDTQYLTIGLRTYNYNNPAGPGTYAANTQTFFIDTVGILASGSRRVIGSATLPMSLQAKETTKLVFRVGPTTPGLGSVQPVGYSIYNIKVTIAGQGRLPKSDMKAFTYLTCLNKLFKKQLGPTVNVISNYLNTNQALQNSYDSGIKFVTVSSGDAARNADNAGIKVTINNMFKDMRRWSLGMGVEGGNIRIEPLAFFFQKDRVIIRLESVANFKWSNANKYLGKSIKTGYTYQVYDDLNGKEDFFGTNNYSYPVKRIDTVLDWVSPLFASPWAIEYARQIGFRGRASTDSQYDNQTFLLEVDPTPVGGKYKLLRRPGFKIGSSDPDSLYNFGLSPATTMQFNAAYLLSMGYGKPLNINDTILFLTSDKNAVFQRHLDSKTIGETDSISLQTLQVAPDGVTPITPLFQPTIFEFEAVIPIAIFTKLKAATEDRYGVIEFPHPENGTIFKMFILDIGFYPATENVYVVRGLSAPDNDLSKL